ncbi:MAG TPA: hypothetical protein VN828_17990 [Acidobacteriaceae bacterium]|nr:hypothetical protein [Acidobacteriaceae bacterium]
MTLMVFLGVVVSLLILRLIPGLLLRLLLAIPRQRVAATMRWVRSRRMGFALSRKSANALADDASITYRRAPAVGRLKLVLVSSSLLVLAVLATTAFWTWHSTALMMMLR